MKVPTLSEVLFRETDTTDPAQLLAPGIEQPEETLMEARLGWVAAFFVVFAIVLSFGVMGGFGGDPEPNAYAVDTPGEGR